MGIAQLDVSVQGTYQEFSIHNDVDLSPYTAAQVASTQFLVVTDPSGDAGLVVDWGSAATEPHSAPSSPVRAVFTYTDIGTGSHTLGTNISIASVRFSGPTGGAIAYGMVGFARVSGSNYTSNFTGPGGAEYAPWTNNPNTSTAWTKAQLLVAEFGVSVTALSGTTTGGFHFIPGYAGNPVTNKRTTTNRGTNFCLNVVFVGIDDINASSGAVGGGETVELIGSGFLLNVTAPAITFGGNAATSVVVNSTTSITCVTPAHSAGVVDVVITNPAFDEFSRADAATYTMSGGYTYGDSTSAYQLALPTGTVYQFATSLPGAYTLPTSEYVNGVFYPRGTIYLWTLAAVPPTDTGWWLSVDEQFAGAGFIVNNGRPKDPRSFDEVTSFTTGATGWMGGFPGPSCVLNNHMIYAAGGYTVGTDSPSIRIWDGRFDREVTRLPNTSAGAVPKAIMTMLAANGTIYLSTLDGGADSTDWASRVFELDIESGTLTPIGTVFTAGHLVYALAWHMNRLWAGTNRQASTAAGKIYYFRPDIDSTWTDDYTLSTSSQAGCTSLLSYKGLLYVGCSAAAATFSKVLVRSELGAYTTSKTSSGGTAVANNAILALVEFESNLYASFFNADTTAVSKIYKFDNSSWTTAYTGASSTLVPFIAFPTDTSTLLAIGGGATYSAVLLYTTDGASWTDATVFLSQGSPASCGLPCFGIVMR